MSAADTTRADEREVAHEPPVVLRDYRPTVRAMVRDTWRQRALLPRLGIRQVIKGYLGTKLGRSWLALRPLIGIFGMALIFGSVLDAPSGDVPYLLFLLVGMTVWTVFERTVFWATRSFDIYSKVAARLEVPLLLPPTAALTPMAIEVGVLTVITVITAGVYWVTEGFLAIEVTPTALGLGAAGTTLALLLAWGFGMWFATLNGLARDTRQVVKFILPVWLYATPVIYSVEALPERWRWLATVNPVTAPVEMVKKGLLNEGSVDTTPLIVSLTSAVVLIASGLWILARLTPSLLRVPPIIEDDEEEEIVL